jgi:hypothetical protein
MAAAATSGPRPLPAPARSAGRHSNGRSTGPTRQEASELIEDAPPELRGAKTAQIVVEVVETGHEVVDHDTLSFSPIAKAGCGADTGGAVVAGDDEACETGGQDERRQVVGGERRDHGQFGKHGPERQDRLDALAGQEPVGGAAEAAAVTEQDAEDLARRVQIRDGQPLEIEPGAVDADNAALEIGDGGEHGGQPAKRRLVVGAIVDERMEAQHRGIDRGDTTCAEIGLGGRAGDRPAGPEQSRAASGVDRRA